MHKPPTEKAASPEEDQVPLNSPHGNRSKKQVEKHSRFVHAEPLHLIPGASIKQKKRPS